ncbi:MAG: hypothetical protein AAGU06_01710 [Candidatus Shapirobacteria bacterium]
MNKITPLKFTFDYLNADNSAEKLKRAYSILFLLAKKNIIDKERQLKINNENKNGRNINS